MFCSNCGKETDKKICRHCGVKNGKVSAFCRWCGEELSPKASICVNCGEKTRPYKAARVITIVYAGLMLPAAVIALILALLGLLLEEADTLFLAIALACVSVIPAIVALFIPKVHNAIKESISKKCAAPKKRRILASWLTVLYVFGGLVFSFGVFWGSGKLLLTEETTTTVEQEKEEEPSYKDKAARAAKVALQNRLRNPASLMVHRTDVQILSVNTASDTIEYEVEVDYSAQNGFGGMNRDTETIRLTYYLLEGYFFSDGRKIIID